MKQNQQVNRYARAKNKNIVQFIAILLRITHIQCSIGEKAPFLIKISLSSEVRISFAVLNNF
jgi:hypothetical protein